MLGLLCATVLLHTSPAHAQERRPVGLDGTISPRTRSEGQEHAASASDVLLFGSLVGAPVFYGAPSLLGPDPGVGPLLDVAMAQGLTWGLTEASKRIFSRRRPYTWFPDHPAAPRGGWCTDRAQRRADDSDDDCRSFWSGHTSLAAVSVTATATSLHLCRQLRPWESVAVFSAAGASTIGVGALRIAAGKHYLSDVIVGGLVGTALGVAAPLVITLVEPDQEAPASPVGRWADRGSRGG